MKKTLRVLLASVLVALSAFAFTACGSKVNEGFRIVHGHYLGYAVVTIDADKKITNVVIDEVQMPYNWAAITDGKIGDVSIAEADRVTTEDNKVFAAAVKVGETVYTLAEGAVNSDAYVVKGKTKTMYEDCTNKKFWDAMAAGEYYVLKADGTAYDIPFTKGTLTKKETQFKSKNGYWTANATNWPLGWKGNMEKIQDFFKGKDKADLGEATSAAHTEQNANNNRLIWSIGGASTGATVSDFKDYYELVKLGYNYAISK